MPACQTLPEGVVPVPGFCQSWQRPGCRRHPTNGRPVPAPWAVHEPVQVRLVGGATPPAGCPVPSRHAFWIRLMVFSAGLAVGERLVAARGHVFEGIPGVLGVRPDALVPGCRPWRGLAPGSARPVPLRPVANAGPRTVDNLMIALWTTRSDVLMRSAVRRGFRNQDHAVGRPVLGCCFERAGQFSVPPDPGPQAEAIGARSRAAVSGQSRWRVDVARTVARWKRHWQIRRMQSSLGRACASIS